MRAGFIGFVFANLLWMTLACEPECRHAIAQAFAERYVPVMQLVVSDLHDALDANLYNVSIPEQLAAIVPETELRDGLRSDLDEGLDEFMSQATGEVFENGIYQAIFSGDAPFKGDCNNPPRLTRKKPPPGESWTLEECEKMDYICGNPPSICHFLDTIKERIVTVIRSQLRDHAAFGNGLLFQKTAQNIKASTEYVITRYGAGSLQRDPSVMAYVNTLASNALRILDTWVATDVEQLCKRPEDLSLCENWDDEIIPEILKWP